jgi:mRNA-degrading endonuclease RelE of RelBE toxin-antitoxin system
MSHHHWHGGMPAKDLARINKALNEMRTDPLSGDIVSLKGEYHGLFRRRVGSWRIVFGLKPKERIILVADILRRTSTTY